MKQKELLDRAENFGQSRDDSMAARYDRIEKLLSQEGISKKKRNEAVDLLLALLEDHPLDLGWELRGRHGSGGAGMAPGQRHRTLRTPLRAGRKTAAGLGML